jgi:hypothetical protein
MHKKCIHLQYDKEDWEVLLFQRQMQIINSWVSVGISLWKLHGRWGWECYHASGVYSVKFVKMERTKMTCPIVLSNTL